MTYEAPKRRSCDRVAIAAVHGCNRPAAAPAPRGIASGSACLDPDTDPAEALLLRIDPPRPTASPTALLALADAALRSPR